MLKVKRVYEPIEKDDGVRVLVDRLWPRGVGKGKVDMRLKDIAPSDELRRWFNHEPAKWESKRRYFEELRNNSKVQVLLQLIKKEGSITLLYATRSPYNNAVALKEYGEITNW